MYVRLRESERMGTLSPKRRRAYDCGQRARSANPRLDLSEEEPHRRRSRRDCGGIRPGPKGQPSDRLAGSPLQRNSGRCSAAAKRAEGGDSPSQRQKPSRRDSAGRLASSATGARTPRCDASGQCCRPRARWRDIAHNGGNPSRQARARARAHRARNPQPQRTASPTGVQKRAAHQCMWRERNIARMRQAGIQATRGAGGERRCSMCEQLQWPAAWPDQRACVARCAQALPRAGRVARGQRACAGLYRLPSTHSTRRSALSPSSQGVGHSMGLCIRAPGRPGQWTEALLRAIGSRTARRRLSGGGSLLFCPMAVTDWWAKTSAAYAADSMATVSKTLHFHRATRQCTNDNPHQK